MMAFMKKIVDVTLVILHANNALMITIMDVFHVGIIVILIHLYKLAHVIKDMNLYLLSLSYVFSKLLLILLHANWL
jgi:hypothetical protein